MNTQRLVGVIGILRILTLVLNVVVLILTGIFRYHVLKELFFLSIVILLIFVSLTLLLILVLDFLPPSIANSLDMSFYLIGGIILLLSTGVMLHSVILIGGSHCDFYYKVGEVCPNLYQPFLPRIILCGISFLNGSLHFCAGIFIKRTEYI